ncbi:Mycobacterium numidiamassiliense ORFan, partial [Mycobacterium numidiamassiliense]
LPVNDYAIDFAAGDELSRIVSRLHLESETPPIERRRLGSDLHGAAYVGRASVLDAHCRPNGRLARASEPGSGLHRCRF